MNADLSEFPVATAKPEQEPGHRDSDRMCRLLELFARNTRLDDVLAEVVFMLGERYSIAHCAILEQRNGRLRCAASAGLSSAVVEQLGRLPSAGGLAFATQAETGELVDFHPAPGWEEWSRAAGEDGLWACRAEPIVSAAGEVLGEVAAFVPDGQTAESVNSSGLRAGARIAGLAIEQRHLAADMLYHAHHDSVTQLPNRLLFDERAAHAISEAARTGGQVALLSIDLDRFQTVNELLGSGVGDLVLEQTARRMEAALAHGAILARTAGDEFTALIPGVTGPGDALRAGELLRARIGAPFAVGGHELTVTASAGCALYPLHAADALALERSAHAALQRAKRGGRNCVWVFAPGEAAPALQRARLETALARAVTRGEFELVYQPQIELRTMAVSGAEALLRWRHPEIGLVSPGAFIPIAEETGLIVPIGEWALREACRQAATWRGLGFQGRVAINISAIQFNRDDFTGLVKSAILDAGVEPEAVELELTESALIGDAGCAAHKMRELKALGLWLAVDDFGTGYSSLARVQELPLDVIKIDISFVRQIAAEGPNQPVIESIIAMAHSLNMSLVAEGVENLVQQSYLAALGCQTVQGFLYGRPAPAADIRLKLDSVIAA